VAEVSANLVKELREKTGVGMMECKKALAECGGDMEKATEHLRKKGMASAAKKSHRTTGEGLVESYIHPGNKVGVLIEVNCETDFVARTDAFRALVHDLAMQVAAAMPLAVSPEELDQDLVAKEREILAEQAKGSGKPEKIIEKMVEGRIQKFYEEVCLLEQPFVKDQDRRVKDIVTEAIAKIGENIRVRRFTRYQLGR
jgi:elongation factor Ts